MKRKLVIVLAVCILFTPLVFALSYYGTSLVYQYRVLGTSRQSITNISPAIEQKNTDQNSEVSMPKEEIKNQATTQPIKGKVVYLTFDDGPDTNVTDDILNTLKTYNIKATFFVIGNQIKGTENVLERIAMDGHSIGLHTWSHNYKYIYANNDNFINEMNWTFNEVKRVTGIESHILRFPGGSTKRLNEQLLDKLHSLNYSVFDWNATTGDGMYPNNPPERLLANLTSPGSKYSTTIVLMHNRSNNVSTSKALPSIIEYYQKLGYSFEAINETTPEYYFRFKKSQ
jgi:peptidoglycan-N-acetylglucosamine deacetylase